jgi:hypothetical protein
MDAQEFVVEGSVQLRRGSLMRIAGARGLTVYVRTGTLWITEEGDPTDHLVQAGGWYRLTRPGVALVSALQTASLSLTAARATPFAGAIELQRRGSRTPEPLLS